MSNLSSAELAAAYADLRGRCVAIGRSLSDEQANSKTECCPDWSVKDILAHLSGINADILSGNTEGAATEPWADAQVQARTALSVEEVCAEWEANAPAIDELLGAMADKMPPPFFLDAWTHEWDIRQATGIGAEPDMRFVDHTWDELMARITELNDGPLEVEIDRFEMVRIAMGRRSRSQIEAQGFRPESVVIWTPNQSDITDAAH